MKKWLLAVASMALLGEAVQAQVSTSGDYSPPEGALTLDISLAQLAAERAARNTPLMRIIRFHWRLQGRLLATRLFIGMRFDEARKIVAGDPDGFWASGGAGGLTEGWTGYGIIISYKFDHGYVSSSLSVDDIRFIPLLGR